MEALKKVKQMLNNLKKVCYNTNSILIIMQK